MSSTSVIEVAGLRKVYRDGWFGRRVEALRDAHLTVERGEIFGLLGPNGAGKTTLIKVLLGIVRKSAGQASVLGQPAGRRAARRKIGYLPEGHRLPRHLTGMTALAYYGGLSGLSSRQVHERGPVLLQQVGLRDWGHTSVRKYSKGMLQRLGLAQAMLHDPDLLILDEPTDGVDPVGRAEIRAVLKRLQQLGKTVFLNSHLLQEIELVCDRVAILVGGRVRRIGPVSEITLRPGAEAVLQLQAAPEDVRRALHEFSTHGWQSSEGRCQTTLRLDGQHTLDYGIDLLRRAGISICSIVPVRVTLEEAFLELVQAEKDESDADSNSPLPDAVEAVDFLP